MFIKVLNSPVKGHRIQVLTAVECVG